SNVHRSHDSKLDSLRELEGSKSGGEGSQADLCFRRSGGCVASPGRFRRNMGDKIPHDHTVLALELGTGGPVSRISSGASQDPLHDERDRVVQRPGTEACQRKRSLSERRVSLQGAVRRGRSRRKAMDEVSTWLEPSHEPVGAPLRGTPAHLNPAIASYTENRTDPGQLVMAYGALAVRSRGHRPHAPRAALRGRITRRRASTRRG